MTSCRSLLRPSTPTVAASSRPATAEAVSASAESTELHRQMVQLNKAGSCPRWPARWSTTPTDWVAPVTTPRRLWFRRRPSPSAVTWLPRALIAIVHSLPCRCIVTLFSLRSDDRPDEALAVSAEAITLRRSLADRDPKRYTEYLADSLFNHSAFLPATEVQEAIRAVGRGSGPVSGLAGAGRQREFARFCGR